MCLVRCQNDARAGPFGGVVPVQLAGAATPAAARRALARRVRQTELLIARGGNKRQSAVDAVYDVDEEEEEEEY